MLAESLASQKPALSSSLTKGVVTIQGGDTTLHHLGMLGSGSNNCLGHSPMGYPAPSPWWAYVPNRHPHDGVLRGIPNTQAVSLWKVLPHRRGESKPPPSLFPFWRILPLPKLTLNLPGIPSAANRSDRSGGARRFGKGRPQPSLFFKRSLGR